MRIPLRRLVKTTWGSRIFTFFLPFMARPSEFTGRKLHHLYGKVSGLTLVPLFPAGLIAQADSMGLSDAAEHLNDWQQLDVNDAIKRHQMMISEVYWTALVFTFVFIWFIALLRWTWHLSLGKLTDRWRTDGQTATIAPLQFFVFQTSGLMSWFALYYLSMAIVGKFAFGHQFETVATFLDTHFLWKVALVSLALLFFVKLYQNNTEVLTEIYGSQLVVQRVRTIGYIAIFISIVLFFWIGILAFRALFRLGAAVVPVAPSQTGMGF